MSALAWFRDPEARSFIARRYLPWLAVLMLAWEVGHAPLYTVWRDAQPTYVAYSILHCTLGDVLIGAFALALSLMLLRQSALRSWRWRQIATVTALLATGYTLFSEWFNISVLRSWAYAESMPTMPIGNTRIGLTPVLQWLTLAPLALYLSRR